MKKFIVLLLLLIPAASGLRAQQADTLTLQTGKR